MVELKEKVGDMWICVQGDSPLDADMNMREAKRALCEHAAVLGWRVRKRGTSDEPKMIVGIAPDFGTVQLEGEMYPVKWSEDYEYA